MKTDFSINVRVALDVTPELSGLVATILAKTSSAGKEQEAPSPAGVTNEGITLKADAVKVEPEQSEQTPPETSQPKRKLTTEDVREAMHRTRQRIEGEDYKNNVDGEQYKKYHKALTAQFKQIAALLGKDKPSELDTEESRASFIAQCDELAILDDGTIGVVAPY